MNRGTYSYITKNFLIALLVLIGEYLIFAFVPNIVVRILLVLAFLLVANHILLEVTLRYKANFMASCLLSICWGLLSYLVMQHSKMGQLHYNWTFWLTTGLNWFVPYLYCLIRQYLDRGPQFPDYNKFFIGMTVLFFIPFTLCFIYLNYVNPDFFAIYHPNKDTYIPFYMTAMYIENITNNGLPVSSLFTYISMYILLFLPIGYHIRLLTRNFSLLFRFAVCIIFCVVAEAIKIPFSAFFCIDTILYSLLGILVGCGLFAFVDYKHYQRKDYEYLYKTSFNFTYRY